MSNSAEVILHEATFNPKVKSYIFLIVLWVLLVSFIGIILIPFWIFGLGQWLSGKFYNSLKCQLTNKNLKFSKGVLVHIEKTIPLENLQDLSFIGGPILRYFSLTMIKVETAGGGGPHNSNMMSMIGVNQAEEFKTKILEQREKIIKEKYSPQQTQLLGSEVQLLRDIKDELIALNKKFEKQA